MLKSIFKPLSSLKLTVVLLSLSMLLIYVGTWAQVDMSIQSVLNKYFHKFGVVWVPFRMLHFHGKDLPTGPAYGFPILGGFVLGLLLLINIVSAYIARFRFTWRDLLVVPAIGLMIVTAEGVYRFLIHAWGYYLLVGSLLLTSIPLIWILYAFHGKRCGVLLIHLALVALLVSEGITAGAKVESQMVITEGESANYVNDAENVELAFVDASPGDHENVVTIADFRLKKDDRIVDPRLPFDIKPVKYFHNSQLLGPMQPRPAGTPEATAGEAAQEHITAADTPELAGTEGMGGSRPAAFLSLSRDGTELGTFLVGFDHAEQIDFHGKTYRVSLRHKRIYKPYTLTLRKFSFDRYQGTEVAKNFSSDVHLSDPSHGVERDVRIWMNHPLHYNGDTIYQQDWDKETEKTTILMVVQNVSWTLPYVALSIGGVGLLVHFSMKLWEFLRKRNKASVLLSTVPQNRKRDSNEIPAERSVWMRWGLALVLFVFCSGYVAARLNTPTEPKADQFDLNTFGQLPVSSEGRTVPFDSLARNTVKVLADRESFDVDGKKVPAIRWLAEVLSTPEKAADLKVFRIDYKELANVFTNDPNETYFSLNQLLAHWDQLGDQFSQLPGNVDRNTDIFQRKVSELQQKMRLYFRVGGVESALIDRPLFQLDDPLIRSQLHLKDDEKRVSLRSIGRLIPEFAKFRDQAKKRNSTELTPMQASVLKFADTVIPYAELVVNRKGLLIIPPLEKGEDWQSMEQVLQSKEDQQTAPPAAAVQMATIEDRFKAGDAAGFNKAVTAYHTLTSEKLPHDSTKADFEAAFNRFDPFVIAWAFYIFALLLLCGSWIGFSRPLMNSATLVLLLAFFVHAGGLIGRIYISGRPPVTNLTSASIFIGFIVIILGMVLQVIYRDGIGLLAASALGIGTALLAQRLALSGDTMSVMQAVLDTNFWLATHVVSVTIGYASTLFAGVLGIILLFGGLFFMDKEQGKSLARTIYGITCFALLFSFTGTILGGLWADQSWGRFWGWDSKENGAALIVLCNALLLHSRWGGIVRERGIALLAIFGNIVVIWSFFGTNLLGVGLHAYGFMDGGMLKVAIFSGSMIALIVLGLAVPMKYWSMSQTVTSAATPPPPPPRKMGKAVATA